MVSSKEEISYNILEKNLNEYEPITDERIKKFIIENKNLYPFLKELYPLIKEFFPEDKVILEYVEDYEEPDWISLHINIKRRENDKISPKKRSKIFKNFFNEAIDLKRKYEVVNLTTICSF